MPGCSLDSDLMLPIALRVCNWTAPTCAGAAQQDDGARRVGVQFDDALLLGGHPVGSTEKVGQVPFNMRCWLGRRHGITARHPVDCKQREQDGKSLTERT